jgi:GAF domain-containing protein
MHMIANKDVTDYLESLSTLSLRGFNTFQAAREAVLQFITEQLAMDSSFFMRIQQDTCEVVAAQNELGRCAIEVGTVVPLVTDFPVLMSDSNEPAPLIQENLHSGESTFSAMFPCFGSYIGVPIVLSDGTLFGALSIMDSQPRQYSLLEAKLLQLLARLLATQIERDQELAEYKWVEKELAQALATLSMEEKNG